MAEGPAGPAPGAAAWGDELARPGVDAAAGERFLRAAVRVLLEDAVRGGTDVTRKVCEWKEPAELRALLDLELRERGEPGGRLLRRCRDLVHYSVKTGHPRFFNQLFSGLDHHALAGRLLTEALNTSQCGPAARGGRAPGAAGAPRAVSPQVHVRDRPGVRAHGGRGAGQAARAGGLERRRRHLRPRRLHVQHVRHERGSLPALPARPPERQLGPAAPGPVRLPREPLLGAERSRVPGHRHRQRAPGRHRRQGEDDPRGAGEGDREGESRGRSAFLRLRHLRHHRPGRLRPRGRHRRRLPAPRPLAARGRRLGRQRAALRPAPAPPGRHREGRLGGLEPAQDADGGLAVLGVPAPRRLRAAAALPRRRRHVPVPDRQVLRRGLRHRGQEPAVRPARGLPQALAALEGGRHARAGAPRRARLRLHAVPGRAGAAQGRIPAGVRAGVHQPLLLVRAPQPAGPGGRPRLLAETGEGGPRHQGADDEEGLHDGELPAPRRQGQLLPADRHQPGRHHGRPRLLPGRDREAGTGPVRPGGLGGTRHPPEEPRARAGRTGIKRFYCSLSAQRGAPQSPSKLCRRSKTSGARRAGARRARSRGAVAAAFSRRCQSSSMAKLCSTALRGCSSRIWSRRLLSSPRHAMPTSCHSLPSFCAICIKSRSVKRRGRAAGGAAAGGDAAGGGTAGGDAAGGESGRPPASPFSPGGSHSAPRSPWSRTRSWRQILGSRSASTASARPGKRCSSRRHSSGREAGSSSPRGSCSSSRNLRLWNCSSLSSRCSDSSSSRSPRAMAAGDSTLPPKLPRGRVAPHATAGAEPLVPPVGPDPPRPPRPRVSPPLRSRAARRLPLPARKSPRFPGNGGVA